VTAAVPTDEIYQNSLIEAPFQAVFEPLNLVHLLNISLLYELSCHDC
jgi:hypothetical protein